MKADSCRNRQDPQRAENVLRLERQNRPMAQHERPQDLPAVLVLENPRLRPPTSLVPLLRRMGPILPAGAHGIGEHPGLEQRVCYGDFGARRDCHCSFYADGKQDGCPGCSRG